MHNGLLSGKGDVKEMGCVYWIQLAQDSPVLCTCGHGNELSGSMKYGEFIEQISDCLLFKKVCSS